MSRGVPRVEIRVKKAIAHQPAHPPQGTPVGLRTQFDVSIARRYIGPSQPLRAFCSSYNGGTSAVQPLPLGIPMAYALPAPSPSPLAPQRDQRVVHNGRSWEQFKSIQTGFEQAPGVRLFYYDGLVEVLMPGREHELFSWAIGHLIGLFLAQKGVFFQPTGAMTQEKEREVSAQADQSFCIGSIKPIPDQK